MNNYNFIKRLCRSPELSVVLILLLILSFNVLNTDDSHSKHESVTKKESITRVVSFAPSITETIFALEAQDKLVAVTDFCHYPDEARSRPSIGGYYNPNYELVTAMKPDSVILLTEHEQAKSRLSSLGISYLVVDHQTIHGVADSFRAIGRVLGRMDAGNAMAQEVEDEISFITQHATGSNRPSVLVSVGRNISEEHISSINGAGKQTMFDEIINLVSANNVIDNTAGYPQVSLEGILTSSPDIIIDLLSDTSPEAAERAREQWESLLKSSSKKAQIYIFNQEYAVIPGPRTVSLIRDIAQAIRPEVEWEKR